MPTRHHIDVDAGIVFSEAWDTLTDSDLRDHQGAVRADPAFAAGLSQVYDFREVDRVEVSVQCLFELARATSYAGGARRAFVVGSDLTHGLANMFRSYAGDAAAEIELFRERAAARHWVETGGKGGCGS